MLERLKVIEQITVAEDGQIRITTVVKVLEDGIEIAQTHPHQHVLAPGDNLEGEDLRVRQVAELIHTRPVIDDYLRAKLEAAKGA